jgi:hypothetical protein
MRTTVKPPLWFWVVGILLLLWEAMGVFSTYQHVTVGPEAMGPATDYDRRLYASLPTWYNAVYAVATVGGLVAAIALLVRSRLAVIFAAVSLVAVVVMFGWMFLATDIVAAKGVWTTYFPTVIFAVALFALWFARTAQARGWIA